MEPITATMIALGASAAAGGLGFALGVAKNSNSATTEEVVPASQVIEEKRTLEQEHSKRERALLELFGAHRGALPSRAHMSDRVAALRTQLVELDADKRVSAVAAFDDQGLMLDGDPDAPRQRALGALLAVTMALGVWDAGASELVWRDEFGNVMTLLQVGQSQPAYLGTWTQGRSLTRAAIARARLALEGEPVALAAREHPGISGSTLAHRDAPAPFVELAEQVRVIGATLSIGSMTLFSHGEHGPLPAEFQRQAVLDAFDGISRLVEGLGSFASLDVRAGRQVTSFMAIETSTSERYSATITAPVTAPIPEGMLDGMLGRLTWQLPSYTELLDIPLREDLARSIPEPRTATPETNARTATGM